MWFLVCWLTRKQRASALVLVREDRPPPYSAGWTPPARARLRVGVGERTLAPVGSVSATPPEEREVAKSVLIGRLWVKGCEGSERRRCAILSIFSVNLVKQLVEARVIRFP